MICRNLAPFVLAILLLLIMVQFGTAQTTVNWIVPTTPWGHPDLQGIWNNVGVTPLERPAKFQGRRLLTDEEVAELAAHAFQRRTDGRRSEGNPTDPERLDRQELYYNRFWFPWGHVSRQTSLITDPSNGRLPAFTVAGRERVAVSIETSQGGGAFEAIGRRGTDGPEQRSLWERCLTRPLPRLPGPYNNNFQIFQTPNHVVILMEMIHESRVIPLDERPHADSNVRQWLGDSRGHWEGSTLVVETTNFSKKTDFIGSQEHLRLVERYTRIGPSEIVHEVRVEDPTTWTRSWTAEIPTRKSEDRIFEYACHEGNYGLVGILAGARSVEEGSRR